MEYKLYNFIKPSVFWDWLDFGITLKINTQIKSSSYYFAVDFQIAWLNIWVQCWKKPIKKLKNQKD
jgi:hypothetical protein